MLSLKLPQFLNVGVGLPSADDTCVRVENGNLPKLTAALVSSRHGPPPSAVTVPSTEPLSAGVAVNAGTTVTASVVANPQRREQDACARHGKTAVNVAVNFFVSPAPLLP